LCDPDRVQEGTAVPSSAEGAFQTQFLTIDDLQIRVAESEPRDSHALLLSPWPESLFAFEPIWDRLAEHAHLVAVDLPGFGHSEGRDSLFAPRAMGEFIIRLADELRLEHPHVVGPDVGTGAALFAAADNPGRIRSVVVGSGAASFPLQLGGRLEDWVVAPDLEALRAVDPRQIVSGTLGLIERYQLPETVREDYLSAYEGDRFVESAAYVRSYPNELRILGELLPAIETPVQIIGGLWDFSVPPSNHRYLDRHLPNAKLDLVDAGHFTWEDAADKYADLVTSWWAGGYSKNASR
jgi:pimeloyl-ACP methyl ester carboxylesterase